MDKKTRGSSDINWSICSVLILLPILITFGFIKYCFEYGCGWKEAVLGIVSYYMANISVGIGTHRLWTHGSYKTTKVVEFILMIVNSGTLQGPVLGWVSAHKRHHAYGDTENDPYTPLKYKNKFKGFLWAHIGWMLVGDYLAAKIDKNTMSTLGKNKMFTWQVKHYVKIAVFMNIIPPMIFGWCVFAEISLQSTLAGLLTVGFARAFQQQMTFCVNSLLHVCGSKKYTSDSSGDIWWLFVFLLGENWHNFHHAFPRDYRNGHKWYHGDFHKLIILLMSKCGLAWDLVETSEERIAAKMSEIDSNIKNDYQMKLADVEIIAIRLANLAKQKVMMLEKSASEMVDSMTNKTKIKFHQIEESAMNLAMSIKAIIAESEVISSKIVNAQIKKLKALQRAAENVGLTI